MRKIILCLLLITSSFTYAYTFEGTENSVSLSGGVEVVSDYNWRGTNVGGLSVQPWIELNVLGFKYGMWSSLGAGPYDDFTQFIPELDLYLSYTSPDGHFTLGLTHYYYFDGPFFGGGYELDKLGSSQSEILVSIFGHDEYPLEIGAAMMFGGGDYYSANGCLILQNSTTAKKLFSTYLYIKYIFTIDNVEIIPEIGLSPAPSMYTYYDGSTGKHLRFAMNNISCKLNYTFLETNFATMYATADAFFNLFDVGYERFEYGKNVGLNIGIGIEL